MSITNVETPALPKRPRLPEELASSTPFLMKRLGFKLKDQSMAAYERAGLHPYHHAVLAVLEDNSLENIGIDAICGQVFDHAATADKTGIGVASNDQQIAAVKAKHRPRSAS